MVLTVVVLFVSSVLLVTCVAGLQVGYRRSRGRGVTTIIEFGHTIRGRFHEIEATGTETVTVYVFPMHSSAFLGSRSGTPLYTDSPLCFSFEYRDILLLQSVVFHCTFKDSDLWETVSVFIYYCFLAYSKTNL